MRAELYFRRSFLIFQKILCREVMWKFQPFWKGIISQKMKSSEWKLNVLSILRVPAGVSLFPLEISIKIEKKKKKIHARYHGNFYELCWNFHVRSTSTTFMRNEGRKKFYEYKLVIFFHTLGIYPLHTSNFPLYLLSGTFLWLFGPSGITRKILINVHDRHLPFESDIRQC